MAATQEPEFLSRRRFLAALAASVVAAGCTLPTGMPTEAATKMIKTTWRETAPMTFTWEARIVFADAASAQKAREEMPELFGDSDAAKAA